MKVWNGAPCIYNTEEDRDKDTRTTFLATSSGTQQSYSWFGVQPTCESADCSLMSAKFVNTGPLSVAVKASNDRGTTSANVSIVVQKCGCTEVIT